MTSVLYKNKKVTKELLIEGADVNALDAQGRTALMLAIAYDDMQMVRLLVASGADVKLEDKQKRTALTMAEKSSMSKKKRKKLIKLLEKAAEDASAE